MAAKTDAVILALTALWQSALTNVRVVDGPQATSDASPDWLFVGSDGGEPTEDTEAGIAEQSWLAFGKIKREDGQVTCAVVSVRGDTEIATARASAYGIVSAAEDALRADLSLGGVVSLQTYISSHTYIPAQTQAGAKVRVVFTVTYQAQL